MSKKNKAIKNKDNSPIVPQRDKLRDGLTIKRAKLDRKTKNFYRKSFR